MEIVMKIRGADGLEAAIWRTADNGTAYGWSIRRDGVWVEPVACTYSLRRDAVAAAQEAMAESARLRALDACRTAEAPDRNGPSGRRAPLPPRRVLGQQAGAPDKGGRPMTEAQARAFIGRQWDEELAGLDWSEWYPVLRWSGRIHDVAPAAMTIAEAAAHGWMYDSGRGLYFLR